MSSYSEITYETPSQPRQLRLDTVTSCNAECLSCHRYGSGRKGAMSIGMIQELLNDAARWPIPLTEIIPVNYGEFFIRKDWYAILIMIATTLPKTQIVIPTNGALLEERDIVQLCQIPTVRIVNLSLNAYFDETYKAFTGLSPKYLHEAEKKVKLLKTLRPDMTVWSSFVFDPMYQTDLERALFIQKWKPLVNGVQVLPAASANREVKPAIIKNKLPCRSIFSDFVVGYDGKLSSCCFDSGFKLDLGTYTGDLKKDWRNERIERLRKLHNEHRRDEIPFCSTCTFA